MTLRYAKDKNICM